MQNTTERMKFFKETIEKHIEDLRISKEKAEKSSFKLDLDFDLVRNMDLNKIKYKIGILKQATSELETQKKTQGLSDADKITLVNKQNELSIYTIFKNSFNTMKGYTLYYEENNEIKEINSRIISDEFIKDAFDDNDPKMCKKILEDLENQYLFLSTHESYYSLRGMMCTPITEAARPIISKLHYYAEQIRVIQKQIAMTKNYLDRLENPGSENFSSPSEAANSVPQAVGDTAKREQLPPLENKTNDTNILPNSTTTEAINSAADQHAMKTHSTKETRMPSDNKAILDELLRDSMQYTKKMQALIPNIEKEKQAKSDLFAEARGLLLQDLNHHIKISQIERDKILPLNNDTDDATSQETDQLAAASDRIYIFNIFNKTATLLKKYETFYEENEFIAQQLANTAEAIHQDNNNPATQNEQGIDDLEQQQTFLETRYYYYRLQQLTTNEPQFNEKAIEYKTRLENVQNQIIKQRNSILKTQNRLLEEVGFPNTTQPKREDTPPQQEVDEEHVGKVDPEVKITSTTSSSVHRHKRSPKQVSITESKSSELGEKWNLIFEQHKKEILSPKYFFLWDNSAKKEIDEFTRLLNKNELDNTKLPQLIDFMRKETTNKFKGKAMRQVKQTMHEILLDLLPQPAEGTPAGNTKTFNEKQETLISNYLTLLIAIKNEFQSNPSILSLTRNLVGDINAYKNGQINAETLHNLVLAKLGSHHVELHDKDEAQKWSDRRWDICLSIITLGLINLIQRVLTSGKAGTQRYTLFGQTELERQTDKLKQISKGLEHEETKNSPTK